MSLENKSGIKLGVLPTHAGFVGALVPEEGRLPRNSNGAIIVLEEIKAMVRLSPIKIDLTQVSVFPGTDLNDLDGLFQGVASLGLELQTVLMVGGVNPWNPEDEGRTVSQLIDGLKIAKQYGIKTVSSTSFEEWMSGRVL